jgi:hypothetical protein
MCQTCITLSRYFVSLAAHHCIELQALEMVSYVNLIEEGAEVLMLLTGLDRPLMHAVICENKWVIFLCLPCSRLLQHPVYLIHKVMIITWLRHPTSSMEFKIRISKSKFSYFSVDRLVQSAIF